MSLRIAVSDSLGAQGPIDDQVNNYYLVESGYDFAGNSAVEVTNLQTIRDFYTLNILDYKQYREGLKSVFADTSGFNSQGTWEKELYAENMISTPAEALTVYSIDEMTVFGDMFHERSVNVRSWRMRRAESVFYARLGTSQAGPIIGDLLTYALKSKYIDYGIESKAIDGSDGIYDYLQATEGTIFESGGLPNAGLTPTGMTMQELSDECYKIMKGTDNFYTQPLRNRNV